MVEVSLRTFSLVDSGGKLVSTWRIGPETVSEAVRAFSQLRGLSGLLWSVITPSAREREADFNERALSQNHYGSETKCNVETRSSHVLLVHLDHLLLPHR